jgi:hypothetical protein
MPAGRIDQPDPLACILSVTKYWVSAIAQIGRCQAGLPDTPKERLNIELATWRKSCALSRYWTNTKENARRLMKRGADLSGRETRMEENFRWVEELFRRCDDLRVAECVPMSPGGRSPRVISPDRSRRSL